MSATRRGKAAATAPIPKSRRLELKEPPGVSPDELVARLVAEGDATNAATALRFVEAEFGDQSLTHLLAALRIHGEAVNRGDLSASERMLNSQAVALNAIFAEMARRAALNLGTYIDAGERYMRLALKAQSQCRATVETLAAIKNPPTVFARQANINNGGQQQVNNGPAPAGAQQYAHARTGESAFGPNELFEDRTHGCTQLDPGATAAAGRPNQGLEPVGALYRPANG